MSAAVRSGLVMGLVGAAMVLAWEISRGAAPQEGDAVRTTAAAPAACETDGECDAVDAAGCLELVDPAEMGRCERDVLLIYRSEDPCGDDHDGECDLDWHDFKNWKQ